MEFKDLAVAIAAFAVVLWALSGMGITIGGASVLGGGAVNGEPTAIVQQAGGCPDTGLVDPYGYVTESIENAATGIKAGIMGTWSIYTPGSVSPYQTGVSTSSAATDLGSLPCGAKGYFAIVNSTTSYYPKKVVLPDIPNAAQVTFDTVELDKIATAQIAFYNSTATGTRASNASVTEQVAGGTTDDGVKIEIKANTARGVIHNPYVAFKFQQQDGANFGSALANVSSFDLQAASENPSLSITKMTTGDCGTATDGYHYVYRLNTDVKDLSSVYVKPVLTANTNFDKINATVRVMDEGYYTAALGDVLFTGCANSATQARPTYAISDATGVIEYNG